MVMPADTRAKVRAATKYRKYVNLMEKLGPSWLASLRPRDVWDAMTPDEHEKEILTVQKLVSIQGEQERLTIEVGEVIDTTNHPDPAIADVPQTEVDAW